MRTTGEENPTVQAVVSAAELIDLQRLVRRIPAPPSLVSFAVRLARSTRPGDDEASPVADRYVAWGAGPRASQYLVLGAKARAASRGAVIPSYEDVRAVAPAVLAHRLVLNFEAEADGRGTRDVIGELLEESKGWTWTTDRGRATPLPVDSPGRGFSDDGDRGRRGHRDPPPELGAPDRRA